MITVGVVWKRGGASLNAIAARLRGPAVAAATQAIADDLQATLVRRVKKRTGYTASTIQVTSAGPLRQVITVGGGGPFLENGTRFMPAQPFIGPAIAECEPRAVDRMRAAVAFESQEG